MADEERSELQVDYAKLTLSFRRLAQTVIDDWANTYNIKLPEQDKYALIVAVGDAMHDLSHKIAMQIDFANNGNSGETKQ